MVEIQKGDPVNIVRVESPEQLRTFIYLPENIHRDYAAFVPPLYRDEFAFHDPKKNAHLRNSDVIRFVAYRKGEPAGRIMGIICRSWNQANKLDWARFYQFDCINDQQVASALTGAIKAWAFQAGMTRLIGPFGFSDKDPQGLQVEGFQYPPVIASVCNEPYLPSLIEKAGFTKLKDCVSYRTMIPEQIPPAYAGIYKRIQARHRVKLIQFSQRRELRPYILPVMRIMNETYRDIFGFMPMSDAEISAMAAQYISFLDPELVKVVVGESGDPVAFIVAMANISRGLKAARGRLLPFGFLHILHDMKTSRQLDLLLGAVAPSFRGRGINVLMGVALMKSALKKGMTVMDSHLVLEENRLMRAELEKIGGTLAKRYRIYHISL
jgi:hypothetical protein